MPLATRLMIAAASILPFGLSFEAFRNGWISPPLGRPFTRRLHPVKFWTLVSLGVVLGCVLIGIALWA